MIEEWRLSEWREDAEQRTNAADAHLVFADRIVRLLDALEAHESEGWAAYAAEQERHAETMARLDLMTREAQLSREATEKAVESRVSRSEIERALRAAGPPEDSMATDELLIHYEGRAEAVEIVRIMLGWTDDCEPSRLHPCVGCGLELDADDPNDRCDECEVGDVCRAPGYNGVHVAVGAGAVGSPPYVCHGCGGTFTPGGSDA